MAERSQASILEKLRQGYDRELFRPQPAQQPFQPAFGTLIELFFRARELWIRCRSGRMEYLDELNATIESIVLFSGIPSDVIQNANFPKVDDLVHNYEDKSYAEIKKRLSEFKNEQDKNRAKTDIMINFTFRAVSEVLLLIKKFLEENHLLHEYVTTVEELEGLTVWSD